MHLTTTPRILPPIVDCALRTISGLTEPLVVSAGKRARESSVTFSLPSSVSRS